ncbi:MAG: hypothetical protein IKZ22_05340 [Kiritimatiellae bacterium]|nr:hypothetical protein [Kiritimatiellia bacterium]
MIRKTRTDAWEAKLSDEDRTKLYALCGHLSYNSAKLLAKSELKITLPGSSSFYRFLARMREEDCALRLAKASQVTKEVGLMAAKSGISDLDLVKSFQNMGAEAALAGDSKTATRLIMMACDLARKGQKQEALRIANEKLKLAQAKEQKATKVIGDKKLSDTERMARLKEIYGL